MRILLVEDNERLKAVIAREFTVQGFTVDALGTVDESLAALDTTQYDALVVDLGLPDGDGMAIVRARGRLSVGTPALVLTARDGSQDLIEALNGGADDYMRKPFSMEELIARLRALLRRPGQVLSVQLRESNVEFDTVGRRVRVGTVEADLSRKELGALELLMTRAGTVVSKAQLEQSLYGFEEEVGQNAIEVLVHRLRKKLSAAGALIEIHTLRGIGYVLSGRSA
ncbi:MAG: response regulator transcription factor [Alsobacter sp.]